MTNTPRPWSADEDRLLIEAVAEYGDELRMWKTIALRVPARSNKACRKRWLHSLSPTVKKTPWTPEEDATLLSLYNSHSPPRWSLIAKHIPGRTDDACSKRYREALDPNLKKDQWTPDEDAALLDLKLQLGSRWSQVGQALGRSGLSCRNRCRLLERKQRSRIVSDIAPTFTESSTSLLSLCQPADCPPFGTESDPCQEFSLGNTIPTPLVHDPSLDQISTSSSLSGALSCVPPVPQLTCNTNLDQGCQSPRNENIDDITGRKSSPPIIVHSCRQSPELNHFPIHGTSCDSHIGTDINMPTQQGSPPSDTELPKPRKRPRLRGSFPPGQDVPRLSSHLPVTMDRTVFPYACAHPACWSTSAGRFATASEVAEHRRLAHPEHDAGKLFRCALEGCGKSWKNINGILYHLQISKAHFKMALSQHTSSESGLGATACDFPSKPKELRCPHEGCTNTYRQRTGLQYHLAHGHPKNVAQLEVLPPELLRLIEPASQSIDSGT